MHERAYKHKSIQSLARGQCEIKAFVLVLIVIVSCLATHGTFAIEDNQLALLLEQQRKEIRAPGLRAAVRYADGRIIKAATGLADKENSILLDSSVRMPGGSTGKTFVAALTMLLVEDGTLSLDDPVSKYLNGTEWFAKLPNKDDILVRHLLSHSAGLKDYPGTIRFNLSMVRRVLAHGSAKFEPEELIQYALKKKPLFPAGEGFRYTDVGYLILGRVIEAASERSYYELLDERILTPLELDQIGIADTSVLENITPGYSGGARNLKKDGRMKLDPSSEWTGGGLTTNPVMLVEFFGALVDGHIVSDSSLKAMIYSGWKNPKQPERYYGFGLFVDRGGDVIGHGGLWSGYRTHVAHIFTSGVTIAVQTNRDGRVDMEGLVRSIYKLVIQEVSKKEETLSP